MRNTLTLKGFILDSLFFYFVGYIWYYAIFFKTIANMSVLHSNLLLLLFLVCFYIVNFVITSKWDRNSKNIIAIMLVGYAYYTYLSYGKYLSNIFIVVGIVGAILIVLYGIWVFGRKIPGTKSFEKIFTLRCRKFYVGMRNIAALAGAVLLVSLFAKEYFVGGLLVSSENSQEVAATEGEEYFFENIDRFMKLQPEEWEKLNNQEKINILQAVVNYESLALGMREKLVIYSSKLEDGLMGYYDYRKSIIQIDVEHLSKDDIEEVYKTVAHEVYHAAQYQYKFIYETLGEEQKKLVFFKHAAMYSEELADYDDGSKNGYLSYYTQQVESDARAYSMIAWHEMQILLKEYFENQEKGEENVPQTEIKVKRTLDDVTVRKEPLIQQETIQYSTGKVYRSTYTYDEKNRYKRVEQYKMDSKTKEEELYQIESYSYDEDIYYVDIEYPMEGGARVKYTYDIYNNPLQIQYIKEDGVDAENYQYQYLCDTNRKQEFTVYSKMAGQTYTDYYHGVRNYNEYGDSVYLVEQNNAVVDASSWEYDYDSKGRKICVYEEHTDGLTGNLSTTKTINTYDDDDRLIHKEENYIKNVGSPLGEFSYRVCTDYEYDLEGRLWEIKVEKIGENIENLDTVIVYEYAN